MPIANPLIVRKWTESELRTFLDEGGSIENDVYDFKQSFSWRQTDNKEIRKDFSAFANTKGGYIFLGVSNRREIIGIDYDGEINTKLNRILSDNLKPKIEWEPLHTIPIKTSASSRRSIHIFYIKESPYHIKPHMSDKIVYIREQGESKPLFSGRDLRDRFFIPGFQPEHIEQLRYELEAIKNGSFILNRVDVYYLRGLRQYLMNEVVKNPTSGAHGELYATYQEIEKGLCDLEELRSREDGYKKVPTISYSADLQQLSDQMVNKIDILYKRYKEIYG